MAGRGPAPKDPSRRARRNAQPIPNQVMRFEPADQPPLPRGVRWPKRTRDWWAMWASAVQSEMFTATDWDFLLDTALVHAAVWSGELNRLSELRVRVSKFGMTPEDRARLRIVFAEADQADAARPSVPQAVSQFGDLRVVPAPKANEDTA